MKIDTLARYTFALATLTFGASGQLVRFIAPSPNLRVTAGQQFQASIAFADTTSSVNVVALFLGAKANDPQANDLGQTELAIITAPKFDSTGPQGQIVHNVNITLPTTLINGLNRTYNITCGQFYTLGAENTALVNVDQVPVFVSSA